MCLPSGNLTPLQPPIFGLSPCSLVAVTTKSYPLPFSTSLTTYSRVALLTVSISVHCSLFAPFWYTLYRVMTAPLLAGCFHVKITLLFFMLHVVFTASGTSVQMKQ